MVTPLWCVLFTNNLFFPEYGIYRILEEPQGYFILDLGDEFRRLQPSKAKIPDAWNGAFSLMHKMSKFRMKQPWRNRIHQPSPTGAALPMDYTMFSRFLTFYPMGCLISDLLQIYEGKFVVRASVQVNGVTRATGMACAETLELAEDRARSRALMVLLPDASGQPEIPARYPTVTTETQPVVKPSLTDLGTDNEQPSDNAPPSEWNDSTISSVPEVPAVESSELAQNGLPQLAVENYGAQSTQSTQSTQSAADAEVGGDKSTRMYDTQQEFESEVVIPFGDEEPAYSSDYNYDENIPAPDSEPKLKPNLKPAQETNQPFDLSDAIAQTSIQLKRLSWSTQHGRKYLSETYGKRSRHDLSDTELLSFLTYLESQPTPNQLPLE